jgi:hypothetical protein
MGPLFGILLLFPLEPEAGLNVMIPRLSFEGILCY